MPVCLSVVLDSILRKKSENMRLIIHLSTPSIIIRCKCLATTFIQSPTAVPPRCKIPRVPAGPSPTGSYTSQNSQHEQKPQRAKMISAEEQKVSNVYIKLFKTNY